MPTTPDPTLTISLPELVVNALGPELQGALDRHLIRGDWVRNAGGHWWYAGRYRASVREVLPRIAARVREAGVGRPEGQP